jgi:hypothetical protein
MSAVNVWSGIVFRPEFFLFEQFTMRTRRPHDGHCMRLLRRKSSDTPIAPLKREHNDLAAIRTGPVAQSVARTKKCADRRHNIKD